MNDTRTALEKAREALGPVAYLIDGGETKWLQFVPDVADADKDLVTITPLYTAPPAPVAEAAEHEPGTLMVCPVRDAICPHGLSCPHNNGWDCDIKAPREALARHKGGDDA